MRLPWRRRRPAHVDPHHPHAFRSPSDGGIAALTPLGGGVGRQVADIAATGAYTRGMGCAVPGCGKRADALIHAPED